MNHTCTYASVKANHAEAFTQAAGHPPFGLTTFELNSQETLLKQKEPLGAPLKRVRVDVAQGLASDPQAPPKCSIKAFKEDKCPPATEVGTNELEVFAKAVDTKVTGQVYNLEPEPIEEGLGGLPLLFGIHVEIPLVANEHVFLKGYLAWFSDYHEYFEIDNINKENPVLKSKLNFNGRAGGNFITLPSECSSTTTSYVELESWTGEGRGQRTPTQTPVGVEGCDKVPFQPSVEVKPETSQSDQPDGAITEVKVPQKAGPEEINSADVKDAHVSLPEGLTLNSAAARGLAACTPAQIRIGSREPVACPAASKVGEVTIEADLPEKSLAGNVYLGGPEIGPITGPPYTIYLDAESAKYGVSVRLQGQVNPNPSTGRLETTFLNNPQQPFSDLILKLKGGPQAPLANPLACGAGQVEAVFTPFTGLAAALSSSPFSTGGCASAIPFSLAQSTLDQPPTAGAHASFTFNLARGDGQQYLASVSTVLPAGLVGLIPSVALCGEPQAASGACPPASQIGVATVSAGAGAEPYAFEGPVFLTGPYGGGPFGLSIAVPAIAGPFNLGTVVARAAINVDPTSARVSVAGAVPTIVGGVPLRLKTISVAVNRANFLLNPTNCGALATETTLTSTFGATQILPTPFAVSNCGALAFKPSFAISTNAATSKANGASLETTLTQGPGQANIKSVSAQLPPQLVTRLTTLQQACPEATFAANPASCPAGSNVGSASAITPVLPGRMSGPAYLVSHAAAAFPDLDLILQGSGVRVVLVGNTNIHQGVTTTTFAAVPDVPVSSFTLALPMGPHSALAANGSLCQAPLVMPTTITAQSGAQVRQNTSVSIVGCGATGARGCIKILRSKVIHHRLALTVRICAAGRISAGGKYLKSTSRKLRKASTTKLTLTLSSAGRRALARHRPLKLRVRGVFVPSRRGSARASASTTVAFRR
ncbi:MAG: hypothetical protein M3Z95_08365 [Actinomycetota bacterium]|nr:hypothetical protein [Actinomycetota bacterium]